MYFYLKEPKSETDTLIILKYFISKKERFFTYSTKLFLNPKEWDKNTKMAIVKRGKSDLASINRKLNNYIQFLDKTLSHFELNNIEITKEKLKEAFSREYRKDYSNQKFTYLTDFIEAFIEKAPGLINRTTKRNYAKTTTKHYSKNNKVLIGFEKYRNKRIRIDSFTIKVYDELVDYLSNTQSYSVNSVGEIIKNVKTLLRKAKELGYEIHEDISNPAFVVLRAEGSAITLNEEEIESIFNHDFSYNNRLQNCRDLAIIGLWTGLRVSDFLTLDEIKKDDKFITVQPKKTTKTSGVKVVIPLHHHIKETIEKRGMPHMISDVKFNKYFKEVCEIVGITEKIKGSKRVRKDENSPLRNITGMYRKCDLISSHTCRRSFATNLYKMDFPTLSIMKITGHTTEKSFLTYIKVTPTEHAEKLLKHWESYYGS